MDRQTVLQRAARAASEASRRAAWETNAAHVAIPRTPDPGRPRSGRNAGRWSSTLIAEGRWWLVRAPGLVAVTLLIAAIVGGASSGGSDGGEAIAPELLTEACVTDDGSPGIMGEPQISAEELESWWGEQQGDADVAEGDAPASELVQAYLGKGVELGVRGDVAFAQAVQASDGFTSGRSQAPQNNPAGVPEGESWGEYATPGDGCRRISSCSRPTSTTTGPTPGGKWVTTGPPSKAGRTIGRPTSRRSTKRCWTTP